MKLAVLIVNYETPEYVEKLVNQFSVFNKDSYDLFIVDNSVLHQTPLATKTNDINIGFDQTVLAWLKEVKDKEYIGYWLLNTDCELDVHENYVDRYKLLLENDINIGLIGSRVVVDGNFGNIPQYNAPAGAVSKVGYVDFQSTVISKELLNKFPFEGSDYFHGGLDFDFNLKSHEMGMYILVDGRTTVFHECDASIKRRDHVEDFKVHCANLGFPWDTDTITTNINLQGSCIFKKYPGLVSNFRADTVFITLRDIKNSIINQEITDYGEFNYNEGKIRYNVVQLSESLVYFRRAAICNVRDAFLFVTSILDLEMNFTDEVQFLESLQTIQQIDNIEYSKTQRDTYNANTKKKKRFAFLVIPDAGHAWDPAHTSDGIGGSEIAAIRISNSLAKLGQEVLVFNNCAEEGVYEGVTWMHKDKFDIYERNNLIDVLIVSRWPEFRFVNPQTQVYFWAHDLNYYKRITTANWQYFDKFLMLSRYHYRFFSEGYPFIPSTHYAILTNGVDLTRFNQQVVRNPKKLIYSSNPDRGLVHLFDIFEYLHNWDPELELHVFGYYPENIRKSPTYWKEMPGVIYRGYTEQYELAAEYMSSKLWLYPCSWLETFCITAIEAQAAGTPSIVSDWGCLRERVGNAGIVIPGTTKDARHINEFVDAAKLLLTNEDEWKKYSDSGKAQALEYTWENAAATLLKISHADNKRK